ncbi:MAG TPA: hypothetical protein VHU84_16960, partial [Lacipirellulaceae bacterium]|nr:hypothetical protein [Lacipirellulaceae bacterium]
GLAAIRLRNEDFADAAGLALEALEHDMQLFRAHYHLGVALAHLDRPEEAVMAFETAAKLNATGAAPFYWLAHIAAKLLADTGLAKQYSERGRDVIRRRREDGARGQAVTE